MVAFKDDKWTTVNTFNLLNLLKIFLFFQIKKLSKNITDFNNVTVPMKYF